MARSEWEEGEIVLPSAAWAEFKAAIRDAVNKSSEERLALALRIHEHMEKSHRGLKGYAFEEAARKFVDSNNRSSYYMPPRFSEDDIREAISAVSNDKGRLRKPLKKDFPLHGNNATSFRDGEASLHFDNEKRKVVWQVSENNHACRDARESALGKAFFTALGKVKWTRGTGGRIWGNDEYNQESGSHYEGGGGSYNKGTFGPDVPKPTGYSSTFNTYPRLRW